MCLSVKWMARRGLGFQLRFDAEACSIAQLKICLLSKVCDSDFTEKISISITKICQESWIRHCCALRRKIQECGKINGEFLPTICIFACSLKYLCVSRIFYIVHLHADVWVSDEVVGCTI